MTSITKLMTKLPLLLSVVLTVAALTACSAKVEGTSPLAASVPSTDNQTPSSPTTSTPTILEGTWASACLALSSQYAMKNTFVFAGNQLTVTVDSFADSQCTNNISTQSQAATFVIGGASTTVAGATPINVVANGQTQYDIFAISGKSLYFGNNPGTTEATRATSLNRQNPMTKIK